jgi:hypothetical protein
MTKIPPLIEKVGEMLVARFRLDLTDDTVPVYLTNTSGEAYLLSIRGDRMSGFF